MSSCGHCSWVQTGSISRPQVARSISSSEFLMAPLSQQPCLIWKLPGYWGLVFLGITRAQAVPACWSGSVLSVLIQNAALSPETRLSHPHSKVFTVLQLILLLGRKEEMQARLVARDANGHLPTSLLAGRKAEVPKSCKCSA